MVLEFGPGEAISFSGSDNFSPIGDGVPTALINNLRRVGVWATGLGLQKLRLGLRFSDDGVNWGATSPIGFDLSGGVASGNYISSEGWGFTSTTIDLSAQTGYALFVQFGVMGQNTSGTNTQGGFAKVRVEAEDLVGGTVIAGPMRVFSQDGTTLSLPATGAIPAQQCTRIRLSLEVWATTGDVTIGGGWQESDTPEDPASWGSTNAFGGTRTTNGITYATTFSSVTPSKQYVRFVFTTVNTAGITPSKGALATMRVDYRGA